MEFAAQWKFPDFQRRHYLVLTINKLLSKIFFKNVEGMSGRMYIISVLDCSCRKLLSQLIVEEEEVSLLGKNFARQ